MAYVDQSANFAYGEQLTSTQMQNLRDNLAATMAKASGAPVLAADYVTSVMIGDVQIGSQHIAESVIGAEKIIPASIGSAELHDDCIGVEQIDWANFAPITGLAGTGAKIRAAHVLITDDGTNKFDITITSGWNGKGIATTGELTYSYSTEPYTVSVNADQLKIDKSRLGATEAKLVFRPETCTVSEGHIFYTPGFDIVAQVDIGDINFDLVWLSD
jgi:hypothetical protein